MDRRDFLKTAAVAATATVTSANAQSAQSSAASRRPESPNMIYHELGRTGERVSAIGMGGYHIGKQQDPDESIRLLRSAIDRGITFMDNCWDYNGGISEVRMGQALRDGYRQKVFLMTKIDGRDKNTAARQIEQSLGRLQTDVIDLLQFHEVIRLDDPDVIFAPGGAIEAVQEAKRAGKIRYIGFTGHKDPSVHLRMFETADKHSFHFDTVQMPINVMDAHFRSFLNSVAPVAQQHGTAILAMKTLWRSLHPPKQYRDTVRSPALRPELPGVGRYHRDRLSSNPRTGIPGRAKLQADGPAAGGHDSRENERSRYDWKV
jgi:uncharacterized protein